MKMGFLIFGHSCFAGLTLLVFESQSIKPTYVLSLLSFLAMTLALLIGPTHVLITRNLPGPSWKTLRRFLGTWSAIWIFIHLAMLWTQTYEFELSRATRGYVWYGWLEFTILHAVFVYIVIMGVTSNDFSQRLLGPSWKRIHNIIRFLYPAIAAAGCYELIRFEISTFLAWLCGVAGLIVPVMMLAARSRLSRS